MFSDIDRQLFRAWRRRRAGSEKGAPRIAIVGNCQNFGIAYGMKILAPQAHVDRFTIVRPGRASIERLAATLRTYDYIFSSDFPPGFLRGGGSARLRELIPNLLDIPTFVFSGYHPDTIYILDPTNSLKPIEGPLGPYHSAIALFAFLKGFDLKKTERLFNETMFQALGYFRIWSPAAAEFLNAMRAAGLDMNEAFLQWSAGAPFMYSINHPKPHVLYDLAYALMRKAGLEARYQPFDLYAVDDLAQGDVFPVYPEVAERLGQPGCYLFKPAHHDIKFSVGRFLNLPEFLAASFAVYARCARAQLMAFRIKEWLDDPQIGEIFDRCAED